MKRPVEFKHEVEAHVQFIRLGPVKRPKTIDESILKLLIQNLNEFKTTVYISIGICSFMCVCVN